jgi:hypothetical protein
MIALALDRRVQRVRRARSARRFWLDCRLTKPNGTFDSADPGAELLVAVQRDVPVEVAHLQRL